MAYYGYNKSTAFTGVHNVKMNLGRSYFVDYYSKKEIVVKLIKVTEKGYNLLNLHTNTCLLKSHIYPAKARQKSQDSLTFSVTKKLIIGNAIDEDVIRNNGLGFTRDDIDLNASLREKVRNFVLMQKGSSKDYTPKTFKGLAYEKTK